MTSRFKRSGVTVESETPSFILFTFAAALLAVSLFLSGCNTAEGMGDDLEDAGEEVEDAID